MGPRIAGDVDYALVGGGYNATRRTDPRIAARIHAALGDARTVLNVGAGAGSYEPTDREVTAVEPAAAMRAQRPAHLPPAVDATAGALPFADDSFDAAMATMTIHQWPDVDRGLRELRRVARGPVVLLAFDQGGLGLMWLADYVPEFLARERHRSPALPHVLDVLGGTATVEPVPVPRDCVDGFIEAFYARPEAFLDPAVRAAQSGWGFLPPEVVDRAVTALRADLASGEWDRRYGSLRDQPEFLGALRLVTALP